MRFKYLCMGVKHSDWKPAVQVRKLNSHLEKQVRFRSVRSVQVPKGVKTYLLSWEFVQILKMAKESLALVRVSLACFITGSV